MQSVSATWNTIFADQDHYTIYKVVIDGTTYQGGDISSLSRSVSLFSGDKFGIGGVNYKEAEVKLDISSDDVPKMAQVDIYARIVSGSATSEWIPKGTYFVDTRETDEDTGELTLSVIDKMLKTEDTFLQDGEQGHWPQTDINVVNQICTRIGVTLDPRTSAFMTNGYLVQYPVSNPDEEDRDEQNRFTMREVLSYIGAMYAGNWTITDDDKLRLIRLSDILIKSSSTAIHSIGYDINSMRINKSPDLIDGVFLKTRDGDILSGAETGNILESDCAWGTQTMAGRILTDANSGTYNPFTADECYYNPALELGDIIEIGDILAPICYEDVTFDLLCIATLEAPVEDEVDHEYDYKAKSIRTFETQMHDIRTEFRVDLNSISATVADVSGNLSSLVVTVNGISGTVTDATGRLSTVEQTIDGLTITTSGGVTKIRGGRIDTSDLVLTHSINIANGFFTVDSSGHLRIQGLMRFWDSDGHNFLYLDNSGISALDGEFDSLNRYGYRSISGGARQWWINDPNSTPKTYFTEAGIGSLTLGGVTRTSWPETGEAVFG